MDNRRVRLNKNKKTKVIFLIALVFIILTGAIVYYLLLPEEKQDYTYQTGKVKKGDLVVSLDGSGVFQYSEDKDLTSTVNGTISEIYVSENSKINAGDSILKVDDSNVLYQLEQANNDLKIAQFKLADLLQTSVDNINRVTYDDVATVYAPDDGVINYTANEGTYVNNNTPTMTLENNKQVYFVAEIYASDINRVKVGQSVELFLRDFSGTTSGVVERVNNTFHSNGYAMVYDVWISVDNPGLFSAGMEGSANIDTPAGEVSGVGKIEEESEAKIYSEINGNIDEIYVNSGEYVTKGTPLFKVSNSSLYNQIETQRLSIENLILKIEQLESDQSQTVMRSSYSGLIKDVYVTPNQVITNNSKIAKIVSNDLVARIEIDELDIGKVVLGQEAELYIPAFSNEPVYGEVTYISDNGIVKDGITTYEVHIGIEANEKIKSGMTVDASILIEKAENTMLVPSSSVIDVKGGKAVRVLVSDKIIAKNVEVGISNDTMTEIISGLELTDIIITSLSYTSSSNQSPTSSSLMPTSVSVPGVSNPGGGGAGGGK